VADENGRSFIVMQYVEGETLDARMKRKPLSISESVDTAAAIADALTEAHNRGIIHRDIMPANIMITIRDQVKVMDFGLARLSQPFGLGSNLEIDDEASTQALLTTPGTIVGTVPYMSPEQVHGQALDARTDIFSFGVVLYQMLTGVQPFAAESPRLFRQFSPESPQTSLISSNTVPELERIIGSV
jgi:serine/threonine protein kinase